MKLDFLSKNIEWTKLNQSLSSGYREILVATHKHSKKDWCITMGYLEPYDNYKKYKIMAKINGMPDFYPAKEINKKDVLAIGFFVEYGYIK